MGVKMLEVITALKVKRELMKKVSGELGSLDVESLLKKYGKAFDSALADLNAELKAKGKGPILSASELEFLLKKNPKLRGKFHALLGKHLNKMGVKGDPKLIGKIASKHLLRAKKIEEMAKVKGFDKALAKNIGTLQNILDSTASHFGYSNVIDFYHKYVTDKGFKQVVDAHVASLIQSDPKLASSALAKLKPGEIIHTSVAIRRTLMTRTEKAKYLLGKTLKRMPIELAKAGGIVTLTYFRQLATLPSFMVFSAMPQLGAGQYSLLHINEFARMFYAQSPIPGMTGDRTTLYASRQYLEELQERYVAG